MNNDGEYRNQDRRNRKSLVGYVICPNTWWRRQRWKGHPIGFKACGTLQDLCAV